jgi:NADPH-dependent curcumin reductase CurA
MQGMVVFDYAPRYAEAVRAMSGWIAEGKLKSKEDIVSGGVAAFPETLLKLFRGENLGKLVLHVADA